jgi:hypothetical protein
MSLSPLEILQDDVSTEKKGSAWGRFVPENKIEELFTKARIKSISTILPDNAFNTSLKVIAILLSMGEVKILDNWPSEGLTDADLPVEYDEKEKVFVKRISEKLTKKFNPFSMRPSICNTFVEKQWEFLAPVFDEGDLKLTKVDESCPLPVIWPDRTKRDDKSSELQETYDQGAFGDVNKIKIHHAHLKPCVVSSIRALFSLLNSGMLKDIGRGKRTEVSYQRVEIGFFRGFRARGDRATYDSQPGRCPSHKSHRLDQEGPKISLPVPVG